MKILVVGNGFIRLERPGGHYVNQHTADLVYGLASLGHDIIYAEAVLEAPAQAGLNNARLSGERVTSLDLNKRSPLALWRAFRAVLDADFVYLFYPGKWSRLIGEFARRLGKPYGIYLRGERFGDGADEVALFKSAKLICTYPGLDARVSRHSTEVVTVAPLLEMDAGDASERYFADFNVRPLRVLFVGRLEEAKGVPELVEAADLLNARGFHCKTRLVGGGPLHADLAERLRNSDSANLELTGLVTEKSVLMTHYEWADILILPSHHEGFPRVLYEGMLKSCVIVTTMVGGIPAIMKDGQNCRSLPLRNANAIAEILESLGGDLAQMRSLADAGRTTVLEVLKTHPSQISSLKTKFDTRNEIARHQENH